MSTQTEARETEPGFSFSDSTKAKAPLKVWLSIALALVGGAVAWTSTTGKVDDHNRRIIDLEQSQRVMVTEQRTQRDILIRIDANVSAMKESRK